MSSSVHVDNKNKDILIFGEGPTEGLDDTTLTAVAKYSIIFARPNKRFVLVYTIVESTVLFRQFHKNISIKSKQIWNKRLYTMYR